MLPCTCPVSAAARLPYAGGCCGTDTLVAVLPAVKLSAQVKQAVLEVEEYIRRENWPAIPHDIMKVPIGIW